MGQSLLHLSINKQIPIRKFEIKKDAERNKSEQRNERSLRAGKMDMLWLFRKAIV